MNTFLHKSAFYIWIVFFICLGSSVECLAQTTSKVASPTQRTSNVMKGSGVGGQVSLQPDSLFALALYGVSYRTDSLSSAWGDSHLSGSASETMNLMGDPTPVFCFATCYKKVILRVEFDDYGTTRDYRHAGGTSWTSSVSLHIVFNPGSGTPSTTSPDPIVLNISSTTPERVYEIDITDKLSGYLCPTTLTSDHAVCSVSVAGYTAPTPTDVQSDINLQVRLIREMQVDPNPSLGSGYKTKLVRLVTAEKDEFNELIYPPASTNGNPLRLMWKVLSTGDESPCPEAIQYIIPSYQVQILKLANIEPEFNANEDKIKAVVNWKNALTIETNSPIPYIDLTIGEGQGFYIWRVRPIGNVKEGGIAHPDNWGSWDEVLDIDGITDVSLEDGDILEIERDDAISLEMGGSDANSFYNIKSLKRKRGSSEITPNISAYMDLGVFFYKQFDNDRNWIFSRTFTEGSTSYGPQFNEKITFANRLLQPTQQQVGLQSKDHILVSSTAYDFAGRPVVKSLPAAIPLRSLSYLRNLFTSDGTLLYSAFDFDLNWEYNGSPSTSPLSLYMNPWPSEPYHTIGSYYSESNSDIAIPSAEGYPFTRTVYDSDPLGRVVEQGGVGKDFRVGFGKTTRTQYMSTPEIELISVFGDEAPKNSSTFKTVTTDPNGVVSIAYTTADGKTVATCLAKNPIDEGSTLLDLSTGDCGDTPVSDLETINCVTVVDTALGNMEVGQNTYYSSATFILSQETNSCTLKYNIERKKIETFCLPLCKYCDYEVEFKLFLVQPNGEKVLKNTTTNTVSLAADQCSEEEDGTYTNSETITGLPAGKYLLTRTIRSNPLIEVSSGNYKTRLESYIDNQNGNFKLALQYTLGNLFGSRYSDHLRVNSLTNPLTDFNDMDKEDYIADLYEDMLIHYQGSTSSALHLITPGWYPEYDCYNVNLRDPDTRCLPPCIGNNSPNFETSLVDAGFTVASAFQEVDFEKDMTVYDHPTGVPQLKLVNPPPNIYKSLFGSATNPFNTVIHNMLISEKYSCTKLWRCWQGTVAAYKAYKETNTAGYPFPPEKGSAGDESAFKDAQYDPKPDASSGNVKGAEMDLLETFFDCVGRQFCSTTDVTATYLASPFAYVRRDGVYGELFDECYHAITGITITPTVLATLVCDNATDPTHDNELRNTLETVWQCMKGKINDVLVKARTTTAGSIEKQAKEDSDSDHAKDCCDPANTAIYDIDCCKKKLEEKMNGDCETECERQGKLAEAAITFDYAHRAPTHYLFEGTTYGDILVEGQPYTAKEDDPLFPSGYELLPQFQLECLVAAAVNHCLEQCKLTITTVDGKVTSVGTETEIERRNKVMTGTLVVHVPPDGATSVVSCPDESYDFVLANTIYTADVYVGYLNKLIDEVQADITETPGERIDINPIIDKFRLKFPENDEYFGCKDEDVYKTEGSFLFIDKADPITGKGKNKFIRYVDDDGQCRIAFKHVIKEHMIDEGMSPVIPNETLESWIRQGRWKADYKKFIDNPLSNMLNEYVRVTWASHQPLERDEIVVDPEVSTLGRTPDADCWVINDLFDGSSCLGTYLSSPGDLYVTGSLYKWCYPPPSTSCYPPTTTGHSFYMPRYWLPNDYGEGSNLEFSYIKDNLLGIRLPCVNGRAADVYGRDMVDFSSTLNYKFELYEIGIEKKDGATPLSDEWGWLAGWFQPENYATLFSTLRPNARTLLNLKNMFNSSTYLGILKIDFTNPYDDTKKSSLEIWMDKVPACSSDFKLYIRHTPTTGTGSPVIRSYAVTYPSKEFDQLVYYGFPNPGGCRNVQLESLRGPDFGTFFDVIGGFYINDDGFLAFDDRELGATTQTVDDFVFTNIRLNCYNENECTKDTADLLCMPCTPSSCGALCMKWEMPVELTANPIKFRVKSCAEVEVKQLIQEIETAFKKEHSEVMNGLRNQYYNNCIKSENIKDAWTAEYDQQYYHYTLYYYDRAGRLVKTIPPAGVVPLLPTGGSYSREETHHTMATTYKYNSLGQMIEQTTPDGGTTKFWYNDYLGKLRYSRSAKQVANNRFSYILYDNLNRITEVGELSPGSAYTDMTLQSAANSSTMSPTAETGIEYTHTYYSDPPSSSTTPTTLPSPFASGAMVRTQRYLQNRVSWTKTKSESGAYTYTYYSYDPHGNVEWVIQDIDGLGASVVDYEYDLISGKVLQASYQDGFKDRFYHRYQYDQDNRVISVETSRDKHIWERDVSYDYYLHGPLRRTVTGRDWLQGTDYTYTIQGWLKAINHPVLQPAVSAPTSGGDPGADGYSVSSVISPVGMDAFGMNLTYYDGDFKHSTSPFDITGVTNSSTKPPIVGDLYNGNIAGWVTSYRDNSGTRSTPLGGLYQYDILNRLRSDNPQTWSLTGSSWGGSPFASEYDYDPNGNFVYLTRSKENGTMFDDLQYHYYTDKNRLKYIDDGVGSTVALNYDIDDQASNNYTYDDNGNMLTDVKEGLVVTWNSSGKVASVVKTVPAVVPPLPPVPSYTITTTFLYDGMGNRVKKSVDYSNSMTDKTTWYVRDATGNVMSTYEKTGSTTTQVENPLYGSDRIGLAKPGVERVNSTNSITTEAELFARDLGLKQYELKDHLGNVRVVLGDKKKRSSSTDAFVPEVVSYSNYYPFGMQMNENTSSSSLYRYGYNGKEKDGELHGEGNSYDYDARIYDPRVGRFLSVDPLKAKSPEISPYVYVGNNPLNYIDPTGESGEAIIDHDNKTIDVNSHIVFYGDQASEENCFKVTQKINEAMNGGANKVSINGAEYTVRFSVTFEIVDSRTKAMSMQGENRNSSCDNYVCLTQDIGVNTDPKTGISKAGESWMRGNVGEWQMTDILSSNGQLNYVVAHEFKHGLGYYNHNALNGGSPMDIGVGGESFTNNAYREVLFAAPNALSLRQLFSSASYNNMFGRTMDVVPFKSSGIQIYRMGEIGLTPPYKGQSSDK